MRRKVPYMGIKAIAPDGKQVELVTKDELGSEGSTIPAGTELIMSYYTNTPPVIIELPNCNVGDTINLLCLTYTGASETTTLGTSKKVSIYSPTPNEKDFWLIFANSTLKYVLCAVKRVG
jgi:hypothetical protein